MRDVRHVMERILERVLVLGTTSGKSSDFKAKKLAGIVKRKASKQSSFYCRQRRNLWRHICKQKTASSQLRETQTSQNVIGSVNAEEHSYGKHYIVGHKKSFIHFFKMTFYTSESVFIN